MEQETFDVDSLNFPEETTVSTGNDEPVKEEPKVEAEPVIADPVKPEKVEIQPEVKPEPDTSNIKISDPPSKYEGESDIQFSLRKQIFDVGQAKAQAETPEEKSELAQHIKGLRKELAVSHKSSDSVTLAPEKIEANKSQAQAETQSEEELAKEALKKMGYLSKDEVAQMVVETLANQSRQDEHLSATQEFYSSHKDLASNPAQRQALERFVVEKFNITPQSTKQDLLIAMDMASGYLFPKNDTRSQRANTSAEKRELVGISSNTQSVPITNKADEKTAAGLKEVGLSPKDMGWD